MHNIKDFVAGHEVFVLICILALVTFATRIGGYAVLARFKTIPRRVQAGLEAVPAAVIATLVVPPAIHAGPAEMIALVIAGIASLRLSALMVIVLGLGVLVALRQMGL
jgi:uncharacterized membrane protein